MIKKLAVFFVSFVVAFGNAKAQSQSEYVYLVLYPDQTLEVFSIHTQTHIATRIEQIKPPHEDWIPYFVQHANLSTISVIFYSFNNQHYIQIFDVITGERRIPLALQGEPSLLPQRVVWSPDALTLAIALLRPTGYTVSLYSVSDHTMKSLNVNEQFAPRIVWNSTSKQIALAMGRCPNSDTCDQRLSIYDSHSGTMLQSVNLSAALTGFSWREPLCNVSWSPASEYVAFVSTCDETSFETPKELYLWKLQSNLVSRITNLTTTRSDETIYTVGRYVLVWLTDNDLLIGAIFGDQAELNTQSIHFQLPELTRTVLSDKAIVEWAANAKYGLVATREVFNLNPNSLETNTQITLAQLNQQTLTPDNKVTLSDGCNLSWSPDGEVLASTLHRTQCTAPVEAIVFYDRTGQEISRHVPAGDPTQRQIIPIGWLAR